MQARKFLIAAVLIAVPPVMSNAQTGMDHSKMNKPAASAATAHSATGVVKSVDRSKNTVMLAHGPVASLKWPAMTMSFAVKDKALLDKLKPGKKTEFEFVQQGKDYVITGVK
jgi:Cu(I)/Ag(I) efflux system protein CusF